MCLCFPWQKRINYNYTNNSSGNYIRCQVTITITWNIPLRIIYVIISWTMVLGDKLSGGNCESKIAPRQWGDIFCHARHLDVSHGSLGIVWAERDGSSFGSWETVLRFRFLYSIYSSDYWSQMILFFSRNSFQITRAKDYYTNKLPGNYLCNGSRIVGWGAVKVLCKAPYRITQRTSGVFSESVKCRFSVELEELKACSRWWAASKTISKTTLGLYFQIAAVRE